MKPLVSYMNHKIFHIQTIIYRHQTSYMKQRWFIYETLFGSYMKHDILSYTILIYNPYVVPYMGHYVSYMDQLFHIWSSCFIYETCCFIYEPYRVLHRTSRSLGVTCLLKWCFVLQITCSIPGVDIFPRGLKVIKCITCENMMAHL